MLGVPPPYVKCEECGEMMHRNATHVHSCKPEKLAEYQVRNLDVEFKAFLNSAAGQFEEWWVDNRAAPALGKIIVIKAPQ